VKSRGPLNQVLGRLRLLHADCLSDGRLLRQFASQGDEEAFALLVRRHGPLVFGVCRRILRHAQDVEDAAQATFLVLARKAGVVPWQESVAGWLHEVAVRVALEARGVRRRRRAREQTVSLLPEKVAPEPSPAADLAEVLDRELSFLPEKYRAPLVLCYLEGRTRDEAAAQLGWPPARVKSRLERGRDLLRVRLARRGLALGAVPASLPLPAPTVSDIVAQATGPGVTGSAARELANEVLATMLATKLKSVGLFLAAAVAVVLGLGLAAHQALSGPEPHPAPGVSAAVPEPEAPAAAPPPTVLNHDGPVRGVAFTPDGRRVATASFDGTVRLWDVVAKKEVHTWKGLGVNSAAAVSRDGKRVAAGSAEGQLRVWDADSGEKVFTRATGQGNVYCVAFSPDGAQVATADHKGTVSLWDARTGELVRQLNASAGRVWSVAFSRDGKLLASGGADGAARLWDAATGKELRQLPRHNRHVSFVAFSPDGKKLLTGDLEDTFRGEGDEIEGRLDTVRVWETATGKELLSIPVPLPHSGDYSPDGRKLVCGDRKGAIHVWDATTGKRLTTLRQHEGPVMAVCFDASGRRLASACQDRTACVWELGK
jgi:RNA polymerase sigma factor (sigma-70 family)